MRESEEDSEVACSPFMHPLCLLRALPRMLVAAACISSLQCLVLDLTALWRVAQVSAVPDVAAACCMQELGPADNAPLSAAAAANGAAEPHAAADADTEDGDEDDSAAAKRAKSARLAGVQPELGASSLCDEGSGHLQEDLKNVCLLLGPCRLIQMLERVQGLWRCGLLDLLRSCMQRAAAAAWAAAARQRSWSAAASSRCA